MFASAALVSGGLVRAGYLLALAGLLGSCQASEAARAHEAGAQRPARERLVGEHEVRAPVARKGLELVLRRGFEVRLREPSSDGETLLRVAPQRARSEEIAAGFVPVGPSVELQGVRGSADVAFSADKFRVRTGHRLVLAVEQAAPCAQGARCWQLVDARYEQGRCVARGVHAGGGRLQFGSLPQNR